MDVAAEPEVDRSWSDAGVALAVVGLAVAIASFVLLGNVADERGAWLLVSAAIGIGLIGAGFLAQQARHPVVGAVGAAIIGLDLAGALAVGLLVWVLSS